jgi:myo-inositol-1(or 4)-monophosphatase
MTNKLKKIGVLAAKKAGAYLSEEYAGFDRSQVRLKSHHEIVSRADLNSEEIIIREIRKEFPSHRILSEERGWMYNSGEFVWIVDPLDGSTNFSMHNPMWAVSIGAGSMDGHGVIDLLAAVVYAPMMGEMYVAEKDGGALLNGRKISVSKVKNGKVLNTFCHGSKEKDIKRAVKYYSRQKLSGLDCRQLGSASLELGFVAAGRIESILIPGANLWDVAAGVLIVQEAGGRVTDFSGRPWPARDGDMLASNGLVHAELLKAVGGS